MTNTERIGNLIFRYIRNELSRKERAELEHWRRLSPVNESTFQDAINHEKIQTDLKVLEESRVTRLEKTAVASPVEKPRQKSVIRRIGVRIIKIAASILLLISTSTGILMYRFAQRHKPVTDSEDQLAAVTDFSDVLRNNTSYNRGFLVGFADLEIEDVGNGWTIGTVPDSTHRQNEYFRLFTSDGNRLQLNYSDSMQIWLNSNSSIKYPAWQKTDTIHIFLSGEAYVHIPPASKHTYEFKISPPADSTTPSAFREAVADKTSRSMFLFSKGGDFHLKAYFKEKATTVSLVTGSLRIDSAGGKAVTPLTLQPGEQAKLDSGNLQILKPERITELWSWKNH